MTSWLVLRFVIGIVSIVLALPIVISIGSVTGWKMTLLATEYGHRLAVVALLMALVGIANQGWIARGGSACLLLAALLWLIPIFQALKLGTSLPSQMKSGKGSSVSWRGLWLGNKPQLIILRRQMVSARCPFTERKAAPKHPALSFCIRGDGRRGVRRSFLNGVPIGLPKDTLLPVCNIDLLRSINGRHRWKM